MEVELGKSNDEKASALASLQKYSQEYTTVAAEKEELEYKYESITWRNCNNLVSRLQRDVFAHKTTEKQLLEALSQQQRSSEEVKALMSAQKELARKWKEESKITVSKYERLLQELRMENQILEKRNHDLTEEVEGMHASIFSL
jgi:hypothetical protein